MKTHGSKWVTSEHLNALRTGAISYDEFRASNVGRAYIERLVAYYTRSRARAGLREDVSQLIELELWRAVQAYEWNCSRCIHKAFGSAADFAGHVERRHGGDPEVAASPTFERWVQGCLGWALAHEMRREAKYRARYKISRRPAGSAVHGAAATSVEDGAELRRLVARAEVELSGNRARAFHAMALGLSAIDVGLRPSELRLLREELRCDWLPSTRTA